VARTGRLLVVHEAVRHGGLGAEIAATIAEINFFDLDAPVARLGGPFTPVPYAPELEQAWLPNPVTIADTLRGLVNS
jgi:pyruvate dehydrogenase E1 component beta subunit